MKNGRSPPSCAFWHSSRAGPCWDAQEPPQSGHAAFSITSLLPLPGILGASPEAPACEELRLVSVLETIDCSTLERSKTVLVYRGNMRDAEQFPFFIASELRALMTA